MAEPVEPIPIPEADARSRKARTVRIQDILAAHARALDVRLEESMREMRLAMESALRRSAIQEAPPAAAPPQPQIQVPPPVAAPQPAAAPEPPPSTLPREDVARGLAQQTEERFQSLAMRLQRIEDAIQTVALARGDSGELGSRLEALTDGMNRVAESEEDLFDRLLEAQREGLEDLTKRVGAGVSAVIRAMQNELSATITRLELTADASAAVSPSDTARLERTMMAIAEHQEAVLDDRLAELRESMASFQQTEETAAEVEAELEVDEKTALEGPRIGVEEAFPWPEPVPDEAIAEEARAAEGSDEAPEAEGRIDAPSAEVSDEAEATGEAEEAGAAETAEEEALMAEAEAVADEGPADGAERGQPQAEVGEASTGETEEAPAPKKRRRKRKRKKAEETG